MHLSKILVHPRVVHIVLSYVSTFLVRCCDVRYDFCKKNDVRFVFAPICLNMRLIYIVCVCLHVVVSGTTTQYEQYSVGVL
jgi:hypothetical protein